MSTTQKNEARNQAITFFVPGEARPAGSKKAFHHKTTGKLIVTDDSGPSGKAWRETVARIARRSYRGKPLEGALVLELLFVVERPQSHFRTGKNAGLLKVSAPVYPAVKPDSTKLTRAVEDALKGITWGDDAQIVDQHAFKRYADAQRPVPGVYVAIRPR